MNGCLFTVAVGILAVVGLVVQGEYAVIGPLLVILVVLWAVGQIISAFISAGKRKRSKH